MPARDKPMVSLHNLPFSDYVDAIRNDEWNAVADMLQQSVRILARAGAEFAVLPDNACHHALPMVLAESPIPILNMVQLCAEAVHESGCSSVGLVGTKYVTNGSTYQSMLGLKGIKLIVPTERDAEEVDGIIFNEAIYGHVRPESIQRIAEVVQGLADRGCEAVVLASSEAALMLQRGAELALPIFDPVEMLAEAAIREAVRPVEA
jgi:aspartate racemase